MFEIQEFTRFDSTPAFGVRECIYYRVGPGPLSLGSLGYTPGNLTLPDFGVREYTCVVEYAGHPDSHRIYYRVGPLGPGPLSVGPL